MLPDRVSNPGPPTYESGALPIALHGPAFKTCAFRFRSSVTVKNLHIFNEIYKVLVLSSNKIIKLTTNERGNKAL